MENSATSVKTEREDAGEALPGPEMRAAPRFTLLIRAAKLVSAQGEFVCVVRDVSETGVCVRLFHACPSDEMLELEMPNGCVYSIRRVWERGNEAGFEFAEPIEVEKLVQEAGEYPKRGLRLGLCFPVSISALTQTAEGIIENLSQQGARLECQELFAIDQNLRVKGIDEAIAFKETRAKVRWRRDRNYGVVFDDTLTLGDFARLAARLQAPALLEG